MVEVLPQRESRHADWTRSDDSRAFPNSAHTKVPQPWRLTMKLIQVGAKGDVHPFDTG